MRYRDEEEEEEKVFVIPTPHHNKENRTPPALLTTNSVYVWTAELKTPFLRLNDAEIAEMRELLRVAAATTALKRP